MICIIANFFRITLFLFLFNFLYPSLSLLPPSYHALPLYALFLLLTLLFLPLILPLLLFLILTPTLVIILFVFVSLHLFLSFFLSYFLSPSLPYSLFSLHSCSFLSLSHIFSLHFYLFFHSFPLAIFVSLNLPFPFSPCVFCPTPFLIHLTLFLFFYSDVFCSD